MMLKLETAKELKVVEIDTKTRTSHISWIPFKKMIDMYKEIESFMKTTNGNHFGFDGMTITEMAQYTEYPEGGFYDWHVDNDVNMSTRTTSTKNIYDLSVIS